MTKSIVSRMHRVCSHVLGRKGSCQGVRLEQASVILDVNVILPNPPEGYGDLTPHPDLATKHSWSQFNLWLL